MTLSGVKWPPFGCSKGHLEETGTKRLLWKKLKGVLNETKIIAPISCLLGKVWRFGSRYPPRNGWETILVFWDTAYFQKLSYSPMIQVCPEKGLISTIPFWGWDLDHQSYSRERSGLLGISFREGHAFWRYFEVFHFCLQGFVAMKLYVLPYHFKNLQSSISFWKRKQNHHFISGTPISPILRNLVLVKSF